MCGIAGAFGWGDLPIEAMMAAMRLRGPDDSGSFRTRSAVLGMTRLAIVDTSAAGHQPMLAANDEVALVFNGEIYNHRALRAELEQAGCHFVSHSDTEVILHLYLQRGEDFVTALRGMFAIAILDRRAGPGREKLILARDHFGIKPLLYWRDGNALVFASDIPALLASGRIEPRLNPQAVRQLLVRGAVCQPQTILQDVFGLMPGHMLLANAEGIALKRFWQVGVGRNRDIAEMSYPAQTDAVRQMLHRIVGEQLVADVPVGAFLSGGVDSSLMVALMAAQKSDPIRTYSIGFAEEDGSLDETEDAALVARHIGTDHCRIEVGAEMVANELDRYIATLGQPSVDGLNSYMVSRAAARDVKVAISGTGGDELFAGYPWYRAMQQRAANGNVAWADRLESGLLKVADLTMSVEPVLRLLPEGFMAHYARQYRHFDPAAAGRLVDIPADMIQLQDMRDLASGDALAGANAVDRTTALCLQNYTLNQLLRDIDATSMAHSLEVRVPFLDPDLADLALSLPEEARLGRQDTAMPAGSYQGEGLKKVVLDAAADLMPPGFMRRAKRGFSMPMQRWLAGTLRPELEASLHALCPPVAAVIRQSEVASVLNDFLEGRVHWGRVWILFVLDRWCRIVFKLSGGSPAVLHPDEVKFIEA